MRRRDRLTGWRRDKRRQDAPAQPAGALDRLPGGTGDSLPVPPAPRNRAERRFHANRIRRLAGKIEMRHEGRRRHNHRTALWQRRALRYVSDSHWADKPGRVAR